MELRHGKRLTSIPARPRRDSSVNSSVSALAARLDNMGEEVDGGSSRQSEHGGSAMETDSPPLSPRTMEKAARQLASAGKRSRSNERLPQVKLHAAVLSDLGNPLTSGEVLRDWRDALEVSWEALHYPADSEDDARFLSALLNVAHNTEVKRRISLWRSQNPHSRTFRELYEFLRTQFVTGVSSHVRQARLEQVTFDPKRGAHLFASELLQAYAEATGRMVRDEDVDTVLNDRFATLVHGAPPQLAEEWIRGLVRYHIAHATDEFSRQPPHRNLPWRALVAELHLASEMSMALATAQTAHTKTARVAATSAQVDPTQQPPPPSGAAPSARLNAVHPRGHGRGNDYGYGNRAGRGGRRDTHRGSRGGRGNYVGLPAQTYSGAATPLPRVINNDDGTARLDAEPGRRLTPTALAFLHRNNGCFSCGYFRMDGKAMHSLRGAKHCPMPLFPKGDTVPRHGPTPPPAPPHHPAHHAHPAMHYPFPGREYR